MEEESFFAKVKKGYSKHPFIYGVICMILLSVIFVWSGMKFLDLWTHHGEETIVPEIKRMTYDQAMEVLEKADLNIEITDSIYDQTLPPGTIIEYTPKAGSVVKPGRKIYVTITAFSPKQVTISMPIIGVSSRQAISYLNALGITGIKIVHVPSRYPDLVEGAKCDGHPISIGSVISVNSSVVLEVGSEMDESGSTDYSSGYEYGSEGHSDGSSEDLSSDEVEDYFSDFDDEEPPAEQPADSEEEL